MIILIGVALSSLIGVLFCYYMIVRNRKLYKYLIEHLRTEPLEEYERYWPYEKMLNTFWRWDFENMKENE